MSVVFLLVFPCPLFSLTTLQRLGVVPSFSRPSVSDDNPYSESLFGTLKYTPAYPGKPFESLAAAREWVHRFMQWYNEEHRHSGIRYVTPPVSGIAAKMPPFWRPGSGSMKPPNKRDRHVGQVLRGTGRGSAMSG
jgi:hypothetical protein